MEDQNPTQPTGQASPEPQKSGGKNTLLIVMGVALLLAVVAIIFLLFAYVFNDTSQPESPEELPPPGIITVESTVIIPTPEPGDPTATVTARAGVNIRTGPGLNYATIATAPYNTELEVVGISQDSTWWVVNVPGAPNNYGWVSDEYVDVANGENALVIPAPPTPTPVATATATATPAPDINFSASRTTINAGEKATLTWSVENISAVYVYPVGGSFANYPVTGQGSRDVQPYITTSYELLTINRDDSTSSTRIEITVVNGLTSGRWQLLSYSSPAGGQKTVIPGTEITARFGADGSLSGSGGCNNFNGGFMAFDQTLRVSNMTSSKALCPEPAGVMEQEADFLTLLQQAGKLAISAGQLTVFDSAGNQLLVFING